VRRMLRRRALAITAAIISLAVIPVTGAVVTASPAWAVSGNLCNLFGQNNYCAGVPGTVANGDHVVLTVLGRDINFKDQGFKNKNQEVYRIQFVADTSQCLGIPANGVNITVRDCSGGNGSNVNWAMEFDTNGYEWRSTTVTGPGGATFYLASDDDLGDQLFVSERDNCPGCLFKWTA
jgi:hypothetical protein